MSTVREMNPQEAHWAGVKGDAYTERNNGDKLVDNNEVMFRTALANVMLESVLEYGANIGLNMIAMRKIYPLAHLEAVEINHKAAMQIPDYVKVRVCSMLQPLEIDKADLVLSKGLLIHLSPEDLPQAYDLYYNTSRKYILLCEYFNPTPIEIPYRGEFRRLWKRDFAGEMLDRFPDMTLVRYGFVYSRALFPQDNINWFLLKKGETNGAAEHGAV